MNKRIMKIVDVLLKQDSYITIDKISEELAVSNKTIRNDLQIVDQYLEENNLKLIKKTGVGIRIDGKVRDKLHVLESVREKNKTLADYSPQARKIFIGMQLSAFDSCRIYELSEQLFVSRATIHKDILSLTKDLETFKIALHRKNNNGISMEGKEKNIRNFLLELMLRDNGYQMFIDIIRRDDYRCDGSYVFPGLEVTDDEVKDFTGCILRWGNPYINSLTFPSMVLVLLRAFVTYLRIQDRHIVHLSTSFIEDLRKEPFYKEARELCDRLANHYRLQIPDVDIRYLQVYFLALQNSRDLSEQEQQEARMLSDALLTSWSEQLHLPFDRDEALRQSVYDHLCPAIIRFRHGIPNENPLMQEIHTLYERTFQVARNSVSVIEEHFHCNVSDDEVGFLALHLAASLENMKQPLKTILVAHGGVGAGNLLRRKLSAQIPEIDIISQETFFSIYECDISDIDLIISTLELNLHTDVTILQVNSLLHDYDILRLKDVIREYYKVKNDPYNFKSAAQE